MPSLLQTLKRDKEAEQRERGPGTYNHTTFIDLALKDPIHHRYVDHPGPRFQLTNQHIESLPPPNQYHVEVPLNEQLARRSPTKLGIMHAQGRDEHTGLPASDLGPGQYDLVSPNQDVVFLLIDFQSKSDMSKTVLQQTGKRGIFDTDSGPRINYTDHKACVPAS